MAQEEVMTLFGWQNPPLCLRGHPVMMLGAPHELADPKLLHIAQSICLLAESN
jgi:hypothetical protein